MSQTRQVASNFLITVKFHTPTKYYGKQKIFRNIERFLKRRFYFVIYLKTIYVDECTYAVEYTNRVRIIKFWKHLNGWFVSFEIHSCHTYFVKTIGRILNC